MARKSTTPLTIVGKAEDKNKSAALEAAMSQIDRAFGKGAVMKLGQKSAMDIEAVSTGSIGLDIALGIGGLPKGRIIEIYGPESSGKTRLTAFAAPVEVGIILIAAARERYKSLCFLSKVG